MLEFGFDKPNAHSQCASCQIPPCAEACLLPSGQLSLYLHRDFDRNGYFCRLVDVDCVGRMIDRDGVLGRLVVECVAESAILVDARVALGVVCLKMRGLFLCGALRALRRDFDVHSVDGLRMDYLRDGVRLKHDRKRRRGCRRCCPARCEE